MLNHWNQRYHMFQNSSIIADFCLITHQGHRCVDQGPIKHSRQSLERLLHDLQSSKQSTARVDALNRLSYFSKAHFFEEGNSFRSTFNPDCCRGLKPEKMLHFSQHLFPITLTLNNANISCSTDFNNLERGRQ